MNPHSPISVVAKAPSACTDEEVSAFKELVLAGGEVNAGTLPELMSRSLALAFARKANSLVAVAAIKRPNVGYRAGVFTKSKGKQDPARFEFELGWVYVSPSARGNGAASALVSALVPALNAAPAYATSRVDNERMHATLKRFGFVAAGVPYPSKINEPEIQLFLRE